jgi:hypothetical protein
MHTTSYTNIKKEVVRIKTAHIKRQSQVVRIKTRAGAIKRGVRIKTRAGTTKRGGSEKNEEPAL